MKPQQLHRYAASADALIRWAKYSTDQEYWGVIAPVFMHNSMTNLVELLGRPERTVFRWKKQATKFVSSPSLTRCLHL